MHLVDKFLEYAQLPTSHNPSGMPPESVRIMKIYVAKYALSLQHNQPNKHNFANFLASLNVSNNLKSVLCNRIGKFLRWEGHLSDAELKEVRLIFRYIPNTWSDKSLSIEQIPHILDACQSIVKKRYAKHRDTLLVYIIATIGCRISQATHITSIQATDNGFIIQFPKMKFIPHNTTATIETRKIPLAHKWGNLKFETLYNTYIQLKPNSQFFFVTPTGNKLSEDYIRKLFAKISKRLSLHITPHTLRHTVGTYIANKYGILQANLLLGHTKIETTQRYIQPQFIDIKVPTL